MNPGTYIRLIWPLLEYVDLVNVMSVNPGFSGQSFIPSTCERLVELLSMLKSIGREKEILIEVDGGIDEKTGKSVIDSGANVLVSGSYIYDSSDRRGKISILKDLK